MGSVMMSVIRRDPFEAPAEHVCTHACDCDCHPLADQGIEVDHCFNWCCMKCTKCGYRIKPGMYADHRSKCHKEHEKSRQ